MADKSLQIVLHHVRKLLSAEHAAELPDHELLGRFLKTWDETAFAVLVERHGPMVLAVCRRVLRHEQNAEDACQAAFLVLARTAGSIRKRTSLSSWLHGVAYRLARKVKQGNARRRVREAQACRAPALGPDSEASWREVQAVLDEELQRLPEKYRAPLVLCYLEGQARDDAARHLGLSLSTLRGRLEQGRDLLRARLARRGVTLSASLLVPVLAADTTAAVPAALVVTTVRLAVQFAAGRATTAGVVSMRSVALAHQMLKGLLMPKLKMGVALLVALGALALGSGMAVRHLAPAEPPQARQAGGQEGAGDGAKSSQAKSPIALRVDADGFPLPDRVVARLGSARLRHGGWVNDVCFSFDGQLIASVGTDKAVRVWDGTTGKQVFVVRRLDGGFDRVAFAADGKVIVAAGHDKAMACDLWRINAATGSVIARFPLKAASPAPAAVRFSRDGSRLAVGSFDMKQLFVIDTAGGGTVWAAQLGKEAPGGAAFAADGNTVAVSTDAGTVRLFDRSGKPAGVLTTEGANLTNLALSPNGSGVVAYDKAKGELIAWDRVTGKFVWRHQNAAGASLTFAPDARTLAQSSYGFTAFAMDAADGKAGASFASMVEATASAFRPDGRVVAFGTISGTIGLFDPTTGKPVAPSADPPHEVRWMRFSNDGKTLYGWSADWFAWDVVTGKQRRVTNTGWNYGEPLSWDGRLTARSVWYTGFRPAGSEDDETRFEIRDAATGSVVHSHSGKAFQGMNWKDLTPDGKAVIGGMHDGTIRAFAIGTGKELFRLPGHKAVSQYHAFSADGRVLVTGAFGDNAEEFPIRVFDLKAGKELAKFHSGAWVVSVSVSADGRRVAAATSANTGGKPDPREVAVVWDVASRKELARVPQHGEGGHVALCPDGRMVAVAARWKEDVRVWEVASQAERFGFRHAGEVTGLVFAPGGRTLAAASKEAPVYLWDVIGDLGGPPPAWDAAAADRVWDDLGAADAAKAFMAVRRLRADPAPAIPFLLDRSKLPNSPDATTLKKLFADLDSGDFRTREMATETLAGFGEAVEDALRGELARARSPEILRRVQRLLDRLTAPTPGRLRLIRAVEAVEGMSAPEAKALLEMWAGGTAGSTLTAEAKAALSRRWP